MLINIHCAKCIGIDAVPITAEIDVLAGVGIHLVGLADAAVKESLLRTITALQSMGYRIPGRKIVINLAPADMHKKGSGYDVPIATGIIAASGQEALPLIEDYLVMGELSLDGGIRDVPGALSIVELAARSGLRGCILPLGSALEAVDISGIEIYGVEKLDEVICILSGKEQCGHLLVQNRRNHPGCEETRNTDTDGEDCNTSFGECMDLSEIIGQESAKRAVEIACAGGHNMLLIGPPGSGKSSLAKAMVKLLPPMTTEESLQSSKVYSIAGKGNTRGGLIRQRPFRSPHYSASAAALLGGGSDNIMPGEVSLAHNGILFMDEFCEAPKRIVEALRSPMEDRHVTISRLKTKVDYPSDFMLVAATNPCPCGYYGEGDRCTCSPSRRIAYLSKLSGPVLDRIDLHVWMSPVNPRKLVERRPGESSAVVAARIKAAREIQHRRFSSDPENSLREVFCNAAMSSRQVERFCRLGAECKELLEKTIEQLGLSARACTRIIRIARTIADLAGDPDILPDHLAEAAGYRFLDKKNIFG